MKIFFGFRKSAGFTLIEILLVIFLVAVLAVIAISNYINNSRYFSFINEYKQVIAVMRTARSFALSNKQITDPAGNSVLPDYYGVQIEEKKIFLFADIGDTPLLYDKKENDADTKYDVVLSGDAGALNVKNIDMALTDYKMMMKDAKEVVLTFPVALFYKISNGEIEIKKESIIGKNETVSKSESKCVSLEFLDASTQRKRYIVIFQVSGMAEEYDELEVCKL